ncbi:MAG: hypothetical protein KGH64_00670 [Candidatus Micrarchaeota archaeon]|nr:hypothetical protein [Candidatus Micrarchaeota archaeon]
MIKAKDRVKVSASFPTFKAKMNNLSVGDTGIVLNVVMLGNTGVGIAMVAWDKGYRTTANTTDLERL